MTRLQEPPETETSAMSDTRCDAIVLFGASGDLAKKMTFVSLYRLAERGLLDMPIIGVAFSEWTDEDLRTNAKADIEATGQKIDDKIWNAMAANMRFVQGDYTKPDTYERVKKALGPVERPLFYLEIPPGLFEVTVKGLHGAGLTENARVIVEKPFGHDYQSAVDLYASLSKMLREEQLYRIDHYLGKNAVQDIMVWRFANRMFEPLWNNQHIDSVQITMSESFDVSDRGSFYDKVGALKDVIQNHIMQVIGLLAMDPPATAMPDQIHASQLEVFQAMRPIDSEHYVRGQYEGYHDVEGVASDSTTETFVGMRIHIDNWRWAGVPFMVRAGKALTDTATEAIIVFKRPPLLLFEETCCPTPEPNWLRMRLGHNDGVQMRIQALDPTSAMASAPVVMNVDFKAALGEERLPYEQLLGDALDGNSTRFATQKIIEGTWLALDHVLENPGPVHTYKRGTMGPDESGKLTAGHHDWIHPIAPPSEQPA
ncbi:MAG: glucose-6-phosphate dehydrogenase [Phycisphaerales bacterium]|nr:glucose-6-phosphate dehydrogenase [Phycisphaerales bacterium]